MGILDRIRPGHLTAFDVPLGDLRLHVQAGDELQDETRAIALRHWEQIEAYVVGHPAFKTSTHPVSVSDSAPPLVRQMAEAAELTGSGPMVSLPGALVEAVARDLIGLSKEVVVSTEGDSFVISEKPRTFVVERSSGEQGGGIAVRVGHEGPYAFYCSSGRLRVDPSIGKARAVAVLADGGAIADAVGSAMGNSMHRVQDVYRALDVCRTAPGVRGALILVGERIGLWGDLEVVAPRGISG